jgi:hypothetical protein
MAGRSSLALKAREFGIELDEKSPELKGLIEELKEREFRGYEYEAADASFKLLVARKLGRSKEFFEVEGYRVIVERHGGEIWSEATVRVKVGGESVHTVAESTGPIGALDKALRLGLEKTYPSSAMDAARLQGAHPRGQRGGRLEDARARRERRRPLDLGHGRRERQHHRRQLGGAAGGGRVPAVDHAQAPRGA